jgi:hypothetical protein
MTFGRILFLKKIVQQLSELPPQKTFSPGGKGGRHFGRNGHIICDVFSQQLEMGQAHGRSLGGKR